MRLETYVSDEFSYYKYSAPLVKQKMIASGYTFNVLAAKYNSISPAVSKLFLLLYIPLTAIALSLIFRGRKKPFYNHFIIASEFNSFMLTVVLSVFPITWLLYRAAGAAGIQLAELSDSVLGWVLGLAFLIFSYAAFKRFYAARSWITFLKTLLFIVVYMFIVRGIYNLVLLATVLLLA